MIPSILSIEAFQWDAGINRLIALTELQLSVLYDSVAYRFKMAPVQL